MNLRMRKNRGKENAIRASEVAASRTKSDERALQKQLALEAQEVASGSSAFWAETEDLHNGVLQAQQQLTHERYFASIIAAERLAREAWRRLHGTQGWQNPADASSRDPTAPPADPEVARLGLLRQAGLDAHIAQQLEEERDLQVLMARRERHRESFKQT